MSSIAILNSGSVQGLRFKPLANMWPKRYRLWNKHTVNAIPGIHLMLSSMGSISTGPRHSMPKYFFAVLTCLCGTLVFMIQPLIVAPNHWMFLQRQKPSRHCYNCGLRWTILIIGVLRATTGTPFDAPLLKRPEQLPGWCSTSRGGPPPPPHTHTKVSLYCLYATLHLFSHYDIQQASPSSNIFHSSSS